MLLFLHGLLAAVSVFLVFGALFFDFIALLRPQRFYSYMAALCACIAVLSFVFLSVFGELLVHQLHLHTTTFHAELHRHIWFAILTIGLFLLAWLIRLTWVRYQFRLIFYFLLEIAVLTVAVFTAHYGTLLVFMKQGI